MKRIMITLIVLVLATGMSIAQTSSVEKNRLTISGTAELVAGQAIINFEQNSDVVDVYVSLTPIGTYLQLYIEKKEKGKITVKANNGSTGKFDYVIIEKFKKPLQENSKQ